MTRYLFVSTPMGPLGSGAGGGVELILSAISKELMRRGDYVHVLAPAGSVIEGVDCTTAPGKPPQYAQNLPRYTPVEIPIPSVLATLWQMAHDMQPHYDVIVNWAYDWLPFYLPFFFQKPVLHVISMGSMTDALDLVLQELLQRFPGTAAVHSLAQAGTFKFAQANLEQGRSPFFILPCGIDIHRYTFVPEASGPICWVGRIAPEKGLEDCAALAQKCNQPVIILGRLQDVDYWHQVRSRFPEAPLYYRGFFPTDEMQRILGQSKALLMTPKWVEAFGVAVVEALACGVPVITYRRGGPTEIVEHGRTGFVIEPDNVEAIAAAIEQLPSISRHECRRHAEANYSMEVMAHKFSVWAEQVLANHPQR